MFSVRAADSQHVYATPWQIWRVLARFEDYSAWNPMLPLVHGKAREGGQLDLKVRIWGKKPVPCLGQVTRAIPYQGLALKCSLAGIPWLLDISLAAYVDPLDTVSCKCTLGLRAKGALVPLVEPLLQKHLLADFAHMGRLLKSLAEAQAPGA